MYLINHIELKHKTKLQKSRRGTNCVPRVPQSKLSFCKSPVEGHKVPWRDKLCPASPVAAKQVHAFPYSHKLQM